MDDIEEIINLFSNVAFPIAGCVVLWFNNREQSKLYRSDVDKLRETVEKNTTVIEAQKEILKELKDKLR